MKKWLAKLVVVLLVMGTDACHARNDDGECGHRCGSYNESNNRKATETGGIFWTYDSGINMLMLIQDSETAYGSRTETQKYRMV